jgi:hypothetical protein
MSFLCLGPLNAPCCLPLGTDGLAKALMLLLEVGVAMAALPSHRRAHLAGAGVEKAGTQSPGMAVAAVVGAGAGMTTCASCGTCAAGIA